MDCNSVGANASQSFAPNTSGPNHPNMLFPPYYGENVNMITNTNPNYPTYLNTPASHLSHPCGDSCTVCISSDISDTTPSTYIQLSETTIPVTTATSKPPKTSAKSAGLPPPPYSKEKPKPKTRQPSSQKSTTPAATPVKVSVSLINTCLTFIRSEMFRKVDKVIIESTAESFGYEEIRAARKELFIHVDVNKQYQFHELKNPPSYIQNLYHCVASIIAKFREIEATGSCVIVSCRAEELHRLNKISNKMCDNIEDRLRRLENDVCDLKAKPPVTKPSSSAPISRESLLSDVLRGQSTPARQRSSSVKRNRSPTDENENGFTRVSSHNKRHKANQNNTIDTHKDLVGADFHDVFLCNYRNIATASVVKQHFKDKYKLSVVSVRQISPRDSDIKSFIMRLRNKDDFDKAIKVLPWKTGARWFVPNMDIDQPKPRLHFNNLNSTSEYLLPHPQESGRLSGTPSRLSSQVHTDTDSSQVNREAVTAQSNVHPNDSVIVKDSAAATPTGEADGASANLLITPIATNSDDKSGTPAAPSFAIGQPVSMISLSASAPINNNGS